MMEREYFRSEYIWNDCMRYAISALNRFNIVIIVLSKQTTTKNMK